MIILNVCNLSPNSERTFEDNTSLNHKVRLKTLAEEIG